MLDRYLLESTEWGLTSNLAEETGGETMLSLIQLKICVYKSYENGPVSEMDLQGEVMDDDFGIM